MQITALALLSSVINSQKVLKLWNLPWTCHRQDPPGPKTEEETDKLHTPLVFYLWVCLRSKGWHRVRRIPQWSKRSTTENSFARCKPDINSSFSFSDLVTIGCPFPPRSIMIFRLNILLLQLADMLCNNHIPIQLIINPPTYNSQCQTRGLEFLQFIV